MRMIRENDPPGILKFSTYVRDNKSCFDIDVTGKSSMKAIYEKSEMSWRELMNLMEQLIAVTRECEKYLLNPDKLLLLPEYIFYEEERFYFCYYPPARQDFWEEFRSFSQYLVKKADYQDELCAKLVCILNNGAMEENYSLDKLMAECMAEKKKATDRDSLYVVKNTIREEDLFREEDNYQAKAREERKEDQTFFQKLFGKKKKSKWGDWENL